MNSKIVFSDDAKKVFLKLKNKNPITKKELTLLKAIEYKFEIIQSKPSYGIRIKKRFIPKEYKLTHGIKTLYRVKLPMFWRMLYTITGDNSIEIIAFVLDIVNHKVYNRTFKYKKK